MTDAQRGHLAMLTFSALVAGSFSLGVMIANDIAPAALNAVRFLLAGVLIGAAASWGAGCSGVSSRHPGGSWFWAGSLPPILC